MRWNAGFSASDEYDYLHLGVDARLERDFNMRNTTAFVGAAYGQDDIKPVGGTPIGLAPMAGEVEDETGRQRQGRGRRFEGRHRRAHRRHAGARARRSLLEVSYSYGQSDGYLTDPYKILSVVDPVTGLPVAGPDGSGPEPVSVRASARTRAPSRACSPSGAMLSTATRCALNFRLHGRRLGRHVADGRRALSLEHQRANHYLEPHLRWYTQSAADFYRTVLFAGDAAAGTRHRPITGSRTSRRITVGAKYGHAH